MKSMESHRERFSSGDNRLFAVISIALLPLLIMGQSISVIPTNADCESFSISPELSTFIMSYHDGGSVSAVGQFSNRTGIDAYKISNYVSDGEPEGDINVIALNTLLELSERVVSYCKESDEWQANLRPRINDNGERNVMITKDTLISWEKNGIPSNLNDPLRDYEQSVQFLEDWANLKEGLITLKNCSTLRIQLAW